MAEKAQKLPDLNEFATDEATADQAALDRLADVAAEKNAKVDKKTAELKNGPSPDIIKMHWDATGILYAEVAVAKKVYDSAKQTLRSRYSEAKADGAPTEAFKKLRKMMELSLDELDAEMLEIARVAGIVKSPIANCTFASMLATADAVNSINPYTSGYTAGKAGDNFTDCPHQPGSEAFETWGQGWHAGQAKLMANSFGMKEKEDGTVPSEKKKRARKVKRSSGKNLH